MTPGTILVVYGQIEPEHKENDKYVPSDAIVSVTSKPKICYPSNATNWANNLCMFVVQGRTRITQ